MKKTGKTKKRDKKSGESSVVSSHSNKEIVSKTVEIISVSTDSSAVSLGLGTHRAWGALLHAHAHFVERIERKLSEQGGISLESYDVLLMLSYAPNHRLRMGELYAAVTLSRSGLTRLVDRLEKKGWVKREVCPNDRRSFEAILTPAGEAARAHSWPLYARAIAEEFGSFIGEKEAITLADLLERPLKSDPHGSQKMKPLLEKPV